MRNSIAGSIRLLLRERINSIAMLNEAINNISSSVGVAREVIYYRSSNVRGDKKGVNIRSRQQCLRGQRNC